MGLRPIFDGLCCGKTPLNGQKTTIEKEDRLGRKIAPFNQGKSTSCREFYTCTSVACASS